MDSHKKRKGFIGITFSLGTSFKFMLLVALLVALAFWAGELDGAARHFSLGDWSWIWRW